MIKKLEWTIDSKRRGINLHSNIVDNSEFIEACKHLDVARLMSVYFQERERPDFLKTQTGFIMNARKERKARLNPHAVNTYSLKTQPPIVAELLREMFPCKYVSSSIKLPKHKCECRLRTYVREYISFKRGYPNNYLHLKEQVQKGKYRGLCIHTLDNHEE